MVPLIEDRADLALAAVNAPGECVISGGERSLAEVAAVLEGRGVTVRRLVTSHAFHSPLMAQVAGEFRDAIRDIRFHEPDIAIVSNVTGEVASQADIATAEYWVRHMLSR